MAPCLTTEEDGGGGGRRGREKKRKETKLCFLENKSANVGPCYCKAAGTKASRSREKLPERRNFQPFLRHPDPPRFFFLSFFPFLLACNTHRRSPGPVMTRRIPSSCNKIYLFFRFSAKKIVFPHLTPLLLTATRRRRRELPLPENRIFTAL